MRYVPKYGIGFTDKSYKNLVYPDDLNEYFDFLEKVFPNVAFILNTRKHEDVLASGWWPDACTGFSHQDNKSFLAVQEAKLKYTEEQLLSILSLRSNFFQISYEEMLSDRKGIVSLFDFLGAHFDQKAIEKVLNTNHSYDNNPENQKNRALDNWKG